MARLFEPRPSQALAADWILARPATALFLPMGAGKTASTLSAMDRLLDRVEVASWLVVSTPRIAESVWRDECLEWQQFGWMKSYCLTADDLPTARVEVVRKGELVKVSKLVNPRALRARIYQLVRKYDFLTVHVDVLPRLVKLFGDDWPWDGVVLDESSLFKNSDTDRVKAMRRVRSYVRWIVELTGTPSPNGIEQLWSQVFLLDGGRRLGRTLTEFRERFMRPARGPDGKEMRNRDRVIRWEPRPGALQEIEALIRDIVMSISEEDLGLQLPELVLNTIRVDLPPAALARYRELEREYLTELDGQVIEAANAAALVTKLKQLANGFLYDQDRQAHALHQAKLDALGELIELTPGPVLLAYNFQEDRRQIRQRFPDAVFVDEREDFKAAWNRGEIRLGVMHPSQGAHGLNLQHGGSVFVWYGPTLDLEHYDQANKRLHRPGQTDAVIVHHLVARGTYDEDAMELLRRKGDIQQAVVASVRRRLEALA